MWSFISPEVVFGEEALSRLHALTGERAFIVTDKNMESMGFIDQVIKALYTAGLECAVFNGVEPNPFIETAKEGAEAIKDFSPDWIVGLGGGSVIDTAKAVWVLYERPDIDPAEINPFSYLGLRKKARFIAIPTTSGTGSETTWALVLTDKKEGRKLGLGSQEVHADIAIVDPVFACRMPPQLTADTGLDALVHSIEGFSASWHNDFCDGLCLKAARLVFEYLPRAYSDGNDMEARVKMHNAASIAGLAFGNSMAGLAHAMGHSLGAVHHIPHGRAVGVLLPYTVDFSGTVAEERYEEIAYFLKLDTKKDRTAARSVCRALKELSRCIDQPIALKDLGIDKSSFEKTLPKLIENAETDTSLVTSARVPETEELKKLFLCAFEGREVDF
jgi:alcohol dehydrogenase class IV